ncbi:hypothetical protein HMI54_005199 [Coelomomyces lativittatus]|nr:hypothetical protein HMI54_005199 [Coelomomyces lativittatus]
MTRRGECQDNEGKESDLEEYLDGIIDNKPLHVQSLFECVEVPAPKITYSADHQAIITFLKTGQLLMDCTSEQQKKDQVQFDEISPGGPSLMAKKQIPDAL